MEEKQKIDLLQRREFINRIVALIEATSNNNGHRTFAIDGEWGSGKTWVLEKIEKELLTMKIEEGKKRFLVIHYNCWEYDYYEEPFIAIVSALLNFVESTKILPSKTKGAVKKVFAKIGEKLLSVGSSLAQPFIGVNIEKTIKEIRAVSNEVNQEEFEKYGFDKFYGFKETVLQLKKVLSKLAEKYSIVICVDELDRCLPEYAIKVLERLHHVFEDIDNLQVLLSIDKNQLDKTVKTIFGDGVNVAGYLTKFIDFTVKLPHGDIDQEKFDLLFENYVKNFRHSSGYMTIKSTDDFINELFAKTNIRRQIKIVEKAKLVHSLMPKTSNLTIDYMAIEMFLTMISFVYDLDVKFNKQITDFNDVINLKSFNERELWVVPNKVFYEEPSGGYARYLPPREDRDFYLFNSNDIWAALFLVMLKQYDVNKIKLMYRYETGYHMDNHYINQIINYSKQFFEILKIVS